jgi:hypothetical protein
VAKDQSTIKLLFEVSPIATWSDKNLHLRNNEMRDRESALCIRLWSQPLVTRREGVSLDKLHFGVSEIATWRVEMPHLQIHETRIHEKHFKHKRLVMAMVI